MTSRFQRMRPTRLLPFVATLLSLLLPSTSSAFIRRDLSPDASFLAAETCRNVPVDKKFKDPMGMAPGDPPAFGYRMLGPDKLDPGFLSSEGVPPYMAVASARMEGRIVEDYEDPMAPGTLVPRPDLMYKFGQQQAEVAFDPSKGLLDRSFGALGLVSASILTVGDCVPILSAGVRPVSRAMARVALKDAERAVERTVARAEVAAARNIGDDAVKIIPGKALLPSEGSVGVYDDLIAAGSKGDNLTPHHIPSANHMGQLGVSRGRGVSIMMEQPVPGVGGRHRATFTSGAAADAMMSSRDALAAGIRDVRRIYMQDDLYDAYMRQQLRQVIQQNKTLYPSVFTK